MSLPPEHARIIASEVLQRNLRKYGITKSDIRKGDYSSLVKANAWSTGVEITHESGETWKPSPCHMLPGTYNHIAADAAEASGRLKFTASEGEKLKHLIEEATRYKVAFEACSYVVSKLIEQGDEIPPELRSFAAKVSRNELPKPKEQGGAAGKKDLGRACLVESIYELADITGMHPTGNDEKAKGKSPHDASFYISGAAGISVSTAKNAWKEAKQAMSGDRKFIAVQRPSDRG